MGGKKVIEIPPEEQLLLLGEAAAYFKVDPGTVKRWMDKGLVKGCRTPGGHRRIYLWSVLEMLEIGRFPKEHGNAKPRAQVS